MDAIHDTANQTRVRLLKIHDLFRDTIKKVKDTAPEIYSKDLLEVIFQHPYCKIIFLENAGIAQRQTASRYLQKLEQIGVLRGVKVGREKYYINDVFVTLLSQ